MPRVSTAIETRANTITADKIAPIKLPQPSDEVGGSSCGGDTGGLGGIGCITFALLFFSYIVMLSELQESATLITINLRCRFHF